MEPTQQAQGRAWAGSWIRHAIAPAIIAIAVVPFVPQIVRVLERASFHAPEWERWRALPVAVQTHVIAAIAALGLGAAMLALPKGRGLHKPFGWAWVAAMAVTAVSSLFMTGLNGGSYSPVHLLTGWTLIALPLGIFAIRNKRVLSHRSAMFGMLGGLALAGALTFIPGRFMFMLFFG